MRLALAFTFTSLSLAACGGGDDGITPMPDAGDTTGFVTPTVTLKANHEASPDMWEELGPADFSCLNTAANDVANTVEVTLTTKVNDFQSGNPVPSATVTAFHNQDQANPFDTQMSDSNANISFTIPVGTKRFGFKMTSSNSLPTFLLNQSLDSPTAATQTLSEIRSVSNATAATLPALIGETRIMGTGILAGALRDCMGHEVSGFIATISSTSGTATTLEGADTYYFSSSVGLPVHHSQAHYGSKDGLFMIIQVPTTTPTAYVQMWGFPTDADLAMGEAGLKLVSEIQVPVIADNVITGSFEPLRTP